MHQIRSPDRRNPLSQRLASQRRHIMTLTRPHRNTLKVVIDDAVLLVGWGWCASVGSRGCAARRGIGVGVVGQALGASDGGFVGLLLTAYPEPVAGPVDNGAMFFVIDPLGTARKRCDRSSPTTHCAPARHRAPPPGPDKDCGFHPNRNDDGPSPPGTQKSPVEHQRNPSPGQHPNHAQRSAPANPSARPPNAATASREDAATNTLSPTPKSRACAIGPTPGEPINVTLRTSPPNRPSRPAKPTWSTHTNAQTDDYREVTTIAGPHITSSVKRLDIAEEDLPTFARQLRPGNPPTRRIIQARHNRHKRSKPPTTPAPHEAWNPDD